MSRPASHTTTSTNAWKKHNILIVDDEPQILEELQTLFELEGFSVTTSLSAEEGLRRLQETPAQLVIADQKMPTGMSGTAFLTQVKASYPGTVTMILSAFSEPDYLMEAVNQAGVHRYLLKPWKQEELLACVSEALQFYHEREVARQTDRQTLTKRVLWENFRLFGEFSGELYSCVFPLLEAGYLMEGRESGFISSIQPMSMFIDQQEMAHTAIVVSKLGQLSTQYRMPSRFRLRQAADPVQYCVIRARAAAEKADIPLSLSVEYEPGLPELWIDTDAFTFAVRALIENAVLFNHLPVTSLREVRVRIYAEAKPEPVIRVEVQDNGPGLADSEKPFFPLYSTCAHQSSHTIDNHSPCRYNYSPLNHTGLGLTLARWNITRHDGVLELVNPGEPCALFRIEIPINQPGLQRRFETRQAFRNDN